METATETEPARRTALEPIEGARLDRRRAMRIGFALLAAALPGIVLRSTLASAAALHSRADALGWFGLTAAPLLWLAVPAAVLGACVLALAPGLLLALALDRARSVEEWVLHGFALSLPVLSATLATAQAMAGSPVRAGGFIAAALTCGAAAGVILAVRLRRGAALHWPFAAAHAAPTLAAMVLVPALLLVALGPKFHWEALNGDGAHAYETARLLLHQPVPFWSPTAGEIAGFPGMTSFLFAYPSSWFIRLFGEIEASARVPLLLFLPPLAAAIIALANHAMPRPLGAAERWLVWAAIAVYTVVISFSATYSPYSADIALPATQDTLLVVAFLGFVLSFIRRAWGWAAAFALGTYLSLPNGLLLLGFWLIAWFLVARPRPWRDVLLGGAIVFGCMVAAGLAPAVLTMLGAPAPGGEYSGARLLIRFAFLQVTDWTRLAYLVVPCGILPALSLLAWKAQDRHARAVTLVTFGYFLFAFVQLRSSLHYYIPAMLLPLVVYWRSVPRDGRRRTIWLPATAVAAAVALVLATPWTARPYRAVRAIGASVEDRVGGYERMAPEQFRASTLLRYVIPYDWDPSVPEAALGTSPLVLNYYAHRDEAAVTRNYVLQAAAAPAPAGARRIAEEEGFAVYVRDESLWREHLALRPPTPPGARLFQQQRGILFASEPLIGGPTVIDLPAIAARLGVDVDAMARRMGVER